eukprot:TRINITY_DN178_c1_g1_i13.p1 TRINITY_DN178_c1_g1~~TRINITY_DN178_c1_g1_i13.p1  ORF type:complete len:140 (+),score=17.32 TRINITY_DN178_c1_g1_i13:86-505(+)
MKTLVILGVVLLCVVFWMFGFSSEKCFQPSFSKRPIVGCEGYWSEDNTPIANPKPWCGKDDFLSKLRAIETVAESDDPGQYSVLTLRGFSTSRIDGSFLGNKEYHSASGMCWTGDFASHYVSDHNVVPSLAFYEFVMST